jgi:hypothetical protein
MGQLHRVSVLGVSMFFVSIETSACTVVTPEATPPSPWDGSVDDGSGSGSGGSSGGFPGPDANACQPGSVITYQPGPYHPPNGHFQGLCVPSLTTDGGTIDPIQVFFDACLGPHRSTAACSAFEASNAACVGCLLTPEAATDYGPVISHGTFVTANVAGCLEVFDPSLLACAQSVQALSGCQLAACEANCAVHDGPSLDAYNACTRQAATGGCNSFATAATCALSDAAPAPCVNPDFTSFYNDVAPRFCGPAPEPDAGGPPPEDASVADATAPAD